MKAAARRTHAITSFCIAVVSLAGAVAWAGPEGDALARQAREKYRNGAFAEAMPLFEKAIEQGASGGELFYQAAFCARTVGGDQAKAKEYFTRALP